MPATENLVVSARLALRRGDLADAVDLALAAALRWGYAGYHRSRHELLANVLAASAGGVDNGARGAAAGVPRAADLSSADATPIPDIAGLLDEAEAMVRRTGDEVALLESFSVRALTMPLTGDVAGVTRGDHGGISGRRAAR